MEAEGVKMDNCAIGFPNSLKFFLELSLVRTVLPKRPNGCNLAACNFHIKALRVWTMKYDIRMVELMHAISIYKA
jgi:hypothetical protein